MAYRFIVFWIPNRFSADRVPLYLGASLGAVTLASIVLVEDGPVLCPFRRCTGGYCPGCGGTRAALTLLRGEPRQAWAEHPWTVLVAVQLMVMGVAIPFLSRTRVASIALPVVVCNLAMGLMIWLVRLWTGTIPVPFS